MNEIERERLESSVMILRDRQARLQERAILFERVSHRWRHRHHAADDYYDIKSEYQRLAAEAETAAIVILQALGRV